MVDCLVRALQRDGHVIPPHPPLLQQREKRMVSVTLEAAAPCCFLSNWDPLNESCYRTYLCKCKSIEIKKKVKSYIYNLQI